jgi:hypothetical protein
MDIHTLMQNLEGDVKSVMIWFQNNFMMLNADKCHLLVTAPKDMVEQMYVSVGEHVIWESPQEKLLGLTIDKRMKFENHLLGICKKASGKLSALIRLANIIPFEKKRILMNAFIESQFSNCPLIWMFCSSKLNARINSLHKRALRFVYSDFTSTFEELLIQDNSVTVHQRNIQLVAIEMFKVIKGLIPPLMKELFVFDPSSRNRTFLRPNVNYKNTGENTIRYFGPIVWDEMLPEKFKSIETLVKFKEEIKTWKPINCPCSLCKTYIGGVGYVTLFE